MSLSDAGLTTRLDAFVLCRDRYTCTRQLVHWLQRAEGVREIILVDNDSTYPPLLDWFKAVERGEGQVPMRVLRVGGNYPAGSVLPVLREWARTHEIRGPVVVSDCDVVPFDTCPRDAIPQLLEIYRGADPLFAMRVGLGLDIVSIPAHYPWRRQARFCEVAYWMQPLALRDHLPLYVAEIDTTFCVTDLADEGPFHCLRSGPPYVAQHTTWWLDPTNLPPDEVHYMSRTGHKGWNFGYQKAPEEHAGRWEPRGWMNAAQVAAARTMLLMMGELNV